MVSPLFIQCQDLLVPHGFFGRRGGVSQGSLASLNGSFKETNQENVRENRRRAQQALNVAPAFFPKQDHTSRVLVLPQDLEILASTPADALVTRDSCYTLGVLTADCAPVFFYDPCGVVGAAHAGWRGALSGILENTLTAMIGLGANPTTTIAVLGPTIRRTSYTVSSSFFEIIVKDSPFGVDECFSSTESGLCFDLPLYIHKRLQDKVARVYDTEVDTFGKDFFSRRYALSQGEAQFGGSISLIALTCMAPF